MPSAESLDELRDADVEHYIQSRGGPLSYYLRTFQFFLRERGLTQAPQPDLLTPRLDGVPAPTAHRMRAYLETLQRRNYSSTTIRGIMYLLTAFIQALSPEQQAQLNLVDRHTISAYIDRLQARSLQGATINNHLSAICSFFRFLLHQELVEHNPVLESHYLRQREAPLPQAMTDEDVRRFLDVIQDRMDRAMFLLLLRSGRARQNPPKECSDERFVRVVHPNHPLVGQLVRVVRQAGHPAYPEGQWVIELADQTRVSLPFSWAVLDDGTEPVLTEAETSPGRLWVDVTALLNLARMVRNLTTNQPEEVESHEPCVCLSHPARETQPPAHSIRPASPLGAPAAGAPARVGHDPGSDADQAATSASPGVQGGGS